MPNADENSPSFALFGATSAIGEQVARLYAANGARLFLAARDPVRLKTIADDLRVRGAAAVDTAVIDFDDITAFEPMLDAAISALGAIDHVLIAYGTLPHQSEAERDAAVAQRHLHTNFVSPTLLLNMLASRVRKGGVIGVITSVAGDRGRQSNYVYGAAKGGLSRFLEGLRHRLAKQDIQVLDIRPGFVRTPMTEGLPSDGPLWVGADLVARDIRRAMAARRARLYTPWFWRVIMGIVRNVPSPIFHKTGL